MSESISLHDILLRNPSIVDKEGCTEKEILNSMNEIDEFKVLKDFQDDHVQSYKVEFIIQGKAYQYSFMWIGDEYRRLFYQSEISKDIRTSQLRQFLAERILYELT